MAKCEQRENLDLLCCEYLPALIPIVHLCAYSREWEGLVDTIRQLLESAKISDASAIISKHMSLVGTVIGNTDQTRLGCTFAALRFVAVVGEILQRNCSEVDAFGEEQDSLWLRFKDEVKSCDKWSKIVEAAQDFAMYDRMCYSELFKRVKRVLSGNNTIDAEEETSFDIPTICVFPTPKVSRSVAASRAHSPERDEDKLMIEKDELIPQYTTPQIGKHNSLKGSPSSVIVDSNQFLHSS